MLAILLVVVALAQDSTACEATDGSALRYEDGRKVGGAVTEGAVESFTWKVADTVLDHVATRYGEVPKPGRLDWAWRLDLTRTLEVTGNAMRTVAVYTTEVRVWRRDGEPLAEGLGGEHTTPMRCTRVTVCCVP